MTPCGYLSDWMWKKTKQEKGWWLEIFNCNERWWILIKGSQRKRNQLHCTTEMLDVTNGVPFSGPSNHVRLAQSDIKQCWPIKWYVDRTAKMMQNYILSLWCIILVFQPTWNFSAALGHPEWKLNYRNFWRNFEDYNPIVRTHATLKPTERYYFPHQAYCHRR